MVAESAISPRCKRSISLCGAKIFLPAGLLSQRLLGSEKLSPPMVFEKKKRISQRRQVFQNTPLRQFTCCLASLRLGETCFPETGASASINSARVAGLSASPYPLFIPLSPLLFSVRILVAALPRCEICGSFRIQTVRTSVDSASKATVIIRKFTRHSSRDTLDDVLPNI